jgi:hypothetical protein
VVGDQTGQLEHLQVLRDGVAADRQVAGQAADGLGAGSQALEDFTPGRICARAKCMAVSRIFRWTRVI